MLRRGVLAWRAGIEPEDLARRSRGLAQRVIEHPRWSEAEGVAAFVGVRGEPDTRPLLRAALAAGKRLWLPRVSDDRARIEFLPVASLDELVPGVMGLLEPPRGAPAPLHAARIRGAGDGGEHRAADDIGVQQAARQARHPWRQALEHVFRQAGPEQNLPHPDE